MPLIGGYPCHNATVPTDLSFTTTAVSACIFLVATIGNSLVLLAVFLDPNKNLRSPFNYFVANLALADLLVGLAVAPLSIIYHVSEGLKSPIKAEMEKYLFYSYFVVCTASLLSLVVLSLDRYVSISYPLRYVAWLDSHRSFVISAAVWVLSVLLSLIFFLVDVNIYRFVFANTAVAATFVILLFSHAKIVRSFRAQVRQWDDLHDNSTENKAKKEALKWEKKMAKTLLVVLAFFLACFLPSCVGIYIINLCSTCSCLFIDWIRDVQFCLVMANSGMNPFVYAYRIKHFRQAFKEIIFCGVCTCQRKRYASESHKTTLKTDTETNKVSYVGW